MQNQINTEVPTKLIEAMGTADASVLAEYVGKKVRVNQGPTREEAIELKDAPVPIRLILGVGPAYEGAEGQIIHVGANGSIWADFGDDEGVIRSPEGRHVAPLGRVNDDASERRFEFIEG